MTVLLDRVEQTRYGVEELREMISPYIFRTALEFYDFMGHGNEVVAKLETTQVTRSFKARGGVATVLHEMNRGDVKGFTTNSAGNHGAGLSYGGKLFDIGVDVYMSRRVPEPKKMNIRHHGGNVVEIEGELEDAQVEAELNAINGVVYGPAYDSEVVALANGTPVLELLEEHPNLDKIFVVAGGGGHAGGAAQAIAEFGSSAELVVVQYETNNSFEKSLRSGFPEMSDKLQTICEGTAVRMMGGTGLRLASNSGVTIRTVTVRAPEVGREIVFEDRKRQPLVPDLGVHAFDYFPEPTAFVAAAGARVFAENHPEVTSEKWGMVLTGSNGDTEKERKLVDVYHASASKK